MTTTTTPAVTASNISRIIKADGRWNKSEAGKATWTEGFTVEDTHIAVRVHYNTEWLDDTAAGQAHSNYQVHRIAGYLASLGLKVIIANGPYETYVVVYKPVEIY